MGERSRATNHRRPTRDMERSSQRQRKFCKQAIATIMADSNSDNFARPVAELWDLSQLPDYPKRVPNPMDLGTIDSKLDNKNAYIRQADRHFSVDKFSEDVRLTFTNAMDFNGKGSEMYDMSEKFLAWFADYMKDLPAEAAPQKGDKGVAEKVGASDAEHTSGGEQLGSDGGSGSETVRTALVARAEELRERRDELKKQLAKPLSLLERIRLRDAIENMEFDSLETVVEILRADVDVALKKVDDKDPKYVDLDLDDVEPAKLREVSVFVSGKGDGADLVKELGAVEGELESLEANISCDKRRPESGREERKRRRR